MQSTVALKIDAGNRNQIQQINDVCLPSNTTTANSVKNLRRRSFGDILYCTCYETDIVQLTGRLFENA